MGLTDEERAAVERWYGLLVSCAVARARRLPRRFEIGDLIAWGSFGLIRAVQGFDPDRWDGEFPSYAAMKIHQGITDGLRRESGGRHNGWTNVWRFEQAVPVEVSEVDGALLDLAFEAVDDRLEAAAAVEVVATELDAQGRSGVPAGQVLRMLASGMSGREVAELLGVHESRISQIKARIRPLLVAYLTDEGEP